MKVLTVVGTRPELIKLSRIVRTLERYTEHKLVHTGQNYDYELNEIFFCELQLRPPDHALNLAARTPAEFAGRVIAGVDSVLERERPDAMLILGDTNSGLSAYAAKRRKIPVFHYEAGNRCFDDRVPEEINRRLIDHISDINLTYSEHARRMLLSEGFPPDRVIKIGSPMREVIEHYRQAIERANVLSELDLAPQSFFLVSAHRQENVDDERTLDAFVTTLVALNERHRLPIIVSTHPRLRARLESLGKLAVTNGVRFLRPLGFFDYVRLQQTARCVISDSGTITEEASILGFPAVMIREAHERHEGMDQATVIMAPLGAGRVIDAVDAAVAAAQSGFRPTLVPDYAPLDVSEKVVRVILSYTDFVNSVVWRKRR